LVSGGYGAPEASGTTGRRGGSWGGRPRGLPLGRARRRQALPPPPWRAR